MLDFKNIFAEKFGFKNWAIFTKITAIYDEEDDHNTCNVVFAEIRSKSPKIMIIASTPGNLM
jgi:hypothetical protein